MRAGVLAVLSSPAEVAPAAAEAPPVVVETPPVPVEAQPEAAVAVPAQHPPARGFGASLRAAGRRGLLLARPLAAPFLHRLQMRMRTAVNESDVAARVAGIEQGLAGIEQALAGLSERFDAEITAARREVGGVAASLAERSDAARREVWEFAANNARRFDAIGRGITEVAASLAERSDAARREVREVAASLAERSDAVRREVAGVGEVAAANARRLGAIGAAADDNALRLDAIQRGIAAVPDVVRAATARRTPIPLGGEVMVWTPDGYLLLPAEDPRLLAAMSEGGVLEHGTRRVLAALLEPGGTLLDVGAHVGTMALPGARSVGESGRVFAVEPLPRLAALLRRNMALNDVADRVTVAACAAGEADAEGLLHLGEVLGHSSLLPPSDSDAGTVRVPVRRIDDVVPAGTRVDVAKIDAEGAELQVWRGMKRVMEESPRLAAVLEFGPSHLARAGVTPEAWLGEVEAPGFAAYMIDEATGVCRTASASALAGVFSVNLLLLRPDAASRHPDLVFA